MKQNFKNILAGFAIFTGIYFLVDLNENKAIVMTMLFVFGLVICEYFSPKFQLDFAKYTLVFAGGFLGYLLTSNFIV